MRYFISLYNLFLKNLGCIFREKLREIYKPPLKINLMGKLADSSFLAHSLFFEKVTYSGFLK